ncbi:tRNA guanosine(34) transglycosylase Tgt [Entomospira culicis]|uniref:Queuine tRNA-ribosyltransferase n=1 Tax=Entomospira culicis TaxID=2719989 RepID=A0A968GIP5_9SPIO|nr:tRNA guanosine(34) transglycosylase Tgt [Entomospira culicis]NIZ19313.1 tRNA guanosine(34) transglycosylase Tgt [Entomospira culicis]NIZ69782.1 tRNA guanosine(34) transglycosylase Tgt [Entomospira culicis]WDI36893.1 tRNA guanosine(34) transglycosylase Tgt [Entomospira culicis]WDI38522.1 tRNA guanosine(34) transglycosylase Tgt [Entomospira culicis]
MKQHFTVIHTDGQARLGTLSLPQGDVATPVFMPVGTVGTMKALHHRRLEELDYRLILANTYHLYLRPGLELLEKMGGLPQFSTWDRNFLTDSGGFQFFSLSKFAKFTEEGVKFSSHIDGSKHFFTPEKAIQAQNIIGSHIKMVLDVCTPPNITEKKAYQAHRTTVDWAKRCQKEWQASGEQGLLFGITQGNFYKDLRKLSIEELAALDLPGYAIGGLSVGEEKQVFEEFVHYSTPLLPANKPRYVMGIGTPDYILQAVEAGVDMFDCVYPTRVARNGAAMSFDGLLSLKNERYALDNNPIDPDCTCSACQRYSKSYLRHLIKAKEINALTLLTDHNLTFMKRFMNEVRASIKENRFALYKQAFMDRYYQSSHKES